MRINRQYCACCKSPEVSLALSAKDHMVSGEVFDIWQCANCTFRFTQAVPPADEIAPYYRSENYISHSDTNKGLINNLYHKVRKRTLASKRSLIEKHSDITKGSLLDIGCGTGSFLQVMQQAGWRVTGLEPDQAARARAKSLYNLDAQEPGVLFDLAPATFDVITLWHVLEHVHDLEGYMQQLNRLLKPGGSLYIAVPNYTSYDASVYEDHWAAYDLPRHLYHFSPAAMKRLLKQYNFNLTGIKPMLFDSFYVSMLSEKYKSGTNNFMKAISVGALSNAKAFFNTEKCSSLIYIAGR